MPPGSVADDKDAPLFFSDQGTETCATVPSKRHAPVPDLEKVWRRRYMGTFVLCGYSMTKGEGHTSPGERILIQRKAKARTKNKSGRAQEQADYIVRFSTTRGFELGRIPVDVASWMSRLLDDGLAEFEACIVDCAAELEVGSDILLEVKAYLRHDAFTTRVTQQCHVDEPESSTAAETRESADRKSVV